MTLTVLAALCVGQIVSRDFTQRGGSWEIDYRLADPAGPDLRVLIAADVSQSRSPAGLGQNPHAAPLFSSVAASVDTPGQCRVVPDVCVERLTVTTPAPEVVRLRLDHDHAVTGQHDPLLGVRRVTIRSGGREFTDTVPLTAETRQPALPGSWPAPPDDRLDFSFYRTAPSALHLKAHEAGSQYIRFPERGVRYSTRVRLRFYFFIAGGGDPDATYAARVAQYEDTPSAWKVLSDGGFEIPLTAVGRWTKVERVFTTEATATTLSFDARITSEAGVGECWISEVSLEEVGVTPHGP